LAAAGRSTTGSASFGARLRLSLRRWRSLHLRLSLRGSLRLRRLGLRWRLRPRGLRSRATLLARG
jgi:hypothetical protein